jgi:hypothetical protein
MQQDSRVLFLQFQFQPTIVPYSTIVLRKHGGDLIYLPVFDRDTINPCLICFSLSGLVETTELLLTAGASVTVCDTDGRLFIHFFLCASDGRLFIHFFVLLLVGYSFIFFCATDGRLFIHFFLCDTDDRLFIHFFLCDTDGRLFIQFYFSVILMVGYS